MILHLVVGVIPYLVLRVMRLGYGSDMTDTLIGCGIDLSDALLGGGRDTLLGHWNGVSNI